MSETRRSPFTEAALERVLDSNLSAKYSLTGILKQDNIINDGFYDLGKVSLISTGLRLITNLLKLCLLLL